MSRKTNREYESEVLVERDIAPTPRECEELRIPTDVFLHSPESSDVWCVKETISERLDAIP